MRAVISNLSIKDTITLLRNKYDSIDENGSFFAMIATEYDSDNNATADIFDVIFAGTQIGYNYVNTIVFPTARFQAVSFKDNLKYVVWLCKNHAKMVFNKDSIREKHIWKDVEWGKRAKNYSPKGKDPGNVWIPTEDDGHANITNHILLDEEGVLARLIKMIGNEDYEVRGTFSNGACLSPQKECFVPQKGKVPSAQGKVVFGTSEKMALIEDKTVKVVVTSPPYWNLKDYFKKGQIGQESYDTYLLRMRSVWQQCYDKLQDEGSLWININIRVSNDNVILIPRDFVAMCKEIGFYYKGIIVWHKSSGIPTGDKNIVDRHEYVLVFSKNCRFDLDQQSLRSYSDYYNSAMNGGAIWNINRKAGSVGKKYIHPAIYPNELVSRIISVASSASDTILDPFLGSGTTLISSLLNGRNCIGYEFNEGFRELIVSRLETDGVDKTAIEFVNQFAE